MIYLSPMLSHGEKNAQFHSQSCFGIISMIHCEGKKNFTTHTYLKLLARPVSSVARNLYSVDSTIYGANIPWLFQVCPGGLQGFFLKEKKPSPSMQWSTFIRAPGFLGQPAIHWNLHSPCFENLERQSLYNFRVNIWHTPYYFLHLWNLQQLLLLSMRMPSCIYSPYLCPLDEWSITWNWISSRMAWDALPCLLEKPYRPHLLKVDTSDNCSFGLEVTDIYASDSLERGAQSTDCELKGLFPIFFPIPRE